IYNGHPSFQPYLELYGPDGKLIAQGANVASATVNNAGTYTFVARDQNWFFQGDYAVEWVSQSNPCSRTLACGTLLTDAIGQIFEMNAYTVVAAVVPVALRVFSATAGFSPLIELYDPNGVAVNSSDWMT